MNTSKNTISFWNKSKKYYTHTEDLGETLEKNPALRKIKETVKPGMKVLDVGCGDGSKLINLGKTVKIKGYGVDVSGLAVNLAKKKAKHYEFKKTNPEKLPFKDNFFDVVFSTYVFEHTTNPQAVLDEMKRVTKKGGHVIIVCPNFGSPIYPSPITPKFKHLKRALLRDLKYVFSKPKTLDWYPETPRLDDKTFQADHDTTILPYVYSLKVLNKSAESSSVWNSISGNSLLIRLLRSPFKALGLIGIYPFKWWGPICYFNLKK